LHLVMWYACAGKINHISLSFVEMHKYALCVRQSSLPCSQPCWCIEPVSSSSTLYYKLKFMSWAFQFLGPFFPKLPFYLYCYLHSYAAVPFKKKYHAAVTVEHHKRMKWPYTKHGRVQIT
jgi:hypothetical protein